MIFNAARKPDVFNRAPWLLLILVLVPATILLFAGAYIGWIPWDDGTMGQAADRVLSGQVPHLDFIDTHTGGLSYFHAVVLAYLGDSAASLRTSLAIVWCITLLPFALIFLRISTQWHVLIYIYCALLLAILLHITPLPSWYNAICAIWCIYFVAKFSETTKQRYLFAAGFCAGVSFLAKLAGLYLLASILIFCLFKEQHSYEGINEGDVKFGSKLFSGVVVLGLLTLVLLVHLLLSSLFSLSAVIIHFLPCLALAGVLIFREFQLSMGTFGQRSVRLGKLLLFALIGFFVPIIMFLLKYYPSKNQLIQWFHGVFIVPQLRLVHSTSIGVGSSYVLSVMFLLLFVAFVYWRIKSPVIRAVVAVVWVLLLVLQPYSGKMQSDAIWMMLYVGQCIIVCSSMVLLLSKAYKVRSDLDKQGIELLFITSAVLCFHSLIQFPYFNGGYLAYVLPLSLIAIAAFSEKIGGPIRVFILCTLLGLLPLGGKLLVKRGLYIPGYLAIGPKVELLELPRAQLYLSSRMASIYRQMVRSVIRTSGTKPIYAGPDCPEVAFLAAKQNIGRTFFEFFEEHPIEDRIESVIEALNSSQVSTIVINRSPNFSSPTPENVDLRLKELFPNFESFARYEVRWRK